MDESEVWGSSSQKRRTLYGLNARGKKMEKHDEYQSLGKGERMKEKMFIDEFKR